MIFNIGKDVKVIVSESIEPISGSDLRHQYHLRDHDGKTYNHDIVDLICHKTNFESISTLIQNLLGINSRIAHQSIHLIGICNDCTSGYKLFEV